MNRTATKPAPDQLALDPQEALVCTMVLVAASNGGISDREVGAMSGIVGSLPVFDGFSAERMNVATNAAVALLREDDGLRHAGRLVRDSLEPRLRETAYALACEVVAADRLTAQDVLRMLEFVRDELRIDPLIAAAIERGARARYRKA